MDEITNKAVTGEKPRAPRNRTVTLSESEKSGLEASLRMQTSTMSAVDVSNSIFNQDLFSLLPFLPEEFIDLLIVDPPYNLNKKFSERRFSQMSSLEYQTWFGNWLVQLKRSLKPTSTVYVCSDWQTSVLVQPILQEHFQIRNRITWEREKGRGALRNWKNCSEDIWFCTVSDDYFFDVDAVKLKRKVIAPYRDASGKPKDWEENETGNYRLTHPSNLWTDITIPFWSMPENTDHPTQKPEKLIAKLILASSRPGDLVFDPFLGSGTTAVAAKKLDRRYCGVESEKEYCLLALKRLEQAEADTEIQGYASGCFWERNAQNGQKFL